MTPYEPGWLEHLRAKHPFPGGWRESSVSDAFALAKRAALMNEPLTYSVMGEPELLAGRMFRDGPQCKTINGEIYARASWLNSRLGSTAKVFEAYSRSGDIRKLGAHIPGKVHHLYLNVLDVVRVLKLERARLKVLRKRHTKAA